MTTEVAVPELVTEAETTPGLLVIPNAQSLVSLDETVKAIDQLAQDFVCLTDADYIRGGEEIVRIRKVDGLFASIFAPVKKFWHEKHQGACGDENKRRGALEIASRLIGKRLLAYKAIKDEEKRRKDADLLALETQRAEDELLAVAEATASGGTAEHLRAAMTVLDQPAALAPIASAPSVPKLAGVKVVGRAAIEWPAFDDFLIAVGATLLANKPGMKKPLKNQLAPFVNHFVKTILENPEFVEKMRAGFEPWVKGAAKQGGSAFQVPGVVVAKKEGLG